MLGAYGGGDGDARGEGLTEKLCREFGLRLEAKGSRGCDLGRLAKTRREGGGLVAAIEKLEPGPG